MGGFFHNIRKAIGSSLVLFETKSHFYIVQGSRDMNFGKIIMSGFRFFIEGPVVSQNAYLLTQTFSII